MPTAPHILFASGGSPSHLNPGLSVAEQLASRMPNASITFAGPANPEHRHLVRTSGYEYLSIPARPTPTSAMQALRFVTDNFAGYCSARWLLREHKVTLVVGLGGYASAVVLKAAAARGTPHILLEQNAIPSPTTRWFSRSSSLVCVPCEQARPHLDVHTAINCPGTAVSPGFENLHRSNQEGICPFPNGPDEVDSKKRRVVILGGVGDSRILNRTVPRVLRQLGTLVDDWQIIHQTGEGQLRQTEQKYRQLGVDALAVSYVDELASVLFSSDLVICRAGGTTLAELALAGVPALLVPLSKEDKSGVQTANARVYCAAGATRMVEETEELTSFESALAAELRQMICDEALRQQMRTNMKALARPQASAEIADAICDTIYGPCEETLVAA